MSASHSVTNSRIGAAIDDLRALDVAELERAAAVGHLAHAVAVGVEVAGVVEDLVRAVRIVGVQLVAEIGDPRRVGRRRHRRALAPEAERDALEHHVAVDRVVDRVADVDVLQRRVTVADTGRLAVERELGEATLQSVDDDDRPRSLEQLDRRVGNVVGEVDLALLQRRDHGVGVGEHAEHDPVDAVVAAVPVRVLLHRPVLTGPPLRSEYGPEATPSVAS